MNRETIEKAANAYSDKQFWIEEDYYARECMDIIAPSAFIAGAQWRINSVWHDASEAPEPNRRTLVCFEENTGSFIYYRIRAFKPNVIKNWSKENFRFDKVLRWAYLDDLLPEGKEDK